MHLRHFFKSVGRMAKQPFGSVFSQFRGQGGGGGGGDMGSMDLTPAAAQTNAGEGSVNFMSKQRPMPGAPVQQPPMG